MPPHFLMGGGGGGVCRRQRYKFLFNRKRFMLRQASAFQKWCEQWAELEEYLRSLQATQQQNQKPWSGVQVPQQYTRFNVERTKVQIELHTMHAEVFSFQEVK